MLDDPASQAFRKGSVDYHYVVSCSVGLHCIVVAWVWSLSTRSEAHHPGFLAVVTSGSQTRSNRESPEPELPRTRTHCNLIVSVAYSPSVVSACQCGAYHEGVKAKSKRRVACALQACFAQLHSSQTRTSHLVFVIYSRCLDPADSGCGGHQGYRVTLLTKGDHGVGTEASQLHNRLCTTASAVQTSARGMFTRRSLSTAVCRWG